MRRLLVSLVAIAAGAPCGCGFMDSAKLYTRCEVPLVEATCPAMELTELVAAKVIESDPEHWGCDLVLLDPIGSAPGTRRPASTSDWEIRTRQAYLDEESLAGALWECGDSISERVELEPAVAATARGAVLQCPVDSKAMREIDPAWTCPAFDTFEPGPACRLLGEKATPIGQGILVAAVTPTPGGAAVVWHAGDRDEQTPTVTWLDVAGEELGERATATPCGALCGTGDVETLTDAYELLPTQQVTSVGDTVIATGLCGDGAVLAISPGPSCAPEALPADEEVASSPHGLGVAPLDDGAESFVLFRQDELMGTSFDPAHATFAETAVLPRPDVSSQLDTRVDCFPHAAGELPACVVVWVGNEDGQNLHLMLADLAAGQGGRDVLFGEGYTPMIAVSPSADPEQRRGLIVWRHPELGLLAVPWGLEPQTSEPTISASPTQLGVGGIYLDMNSAVTWSISPPTVRAAGENSFVVGWWRLVESAVEPTGAFRLELRHVRVDPTSGALAVTPIELAHTDGEVATAVEVRVEGRPIFAPSCGDGSTATPCDSIARPHLAWEEDATTASLWVAWLFDPIANIVRVRRFSASIAAPEWPARVQLTSAENEFATLPIETLELYREGDAVLVDQGLVVAFPVSPRIDPETSEMIPVGASVALVERSALEVTQQEIMLEVFESTFDILTSIGLWADPTSAEGEVVAVYSYDTTLFDYTSFSALGGVTLRASGGALQTPTPTRRLWPLDGSGADDGSSSATSPAVLRGAEARLVWTVKTGGGMSLREQTGEMDIGVGETRYEPRLSTVTFDAGGVLGLEGWNGTTHAIPTPIVARLVPRVGLASAVSDPDDGDWVYLSTSSFSAISSAMYTPDMGEGSENLAFSGVLRFERGASAASAEHLYTDSAWFLPTGIADLGGLVLVVGSTLDPDWTTAAGVVTPRAFLSADLEGIDADVTSGSEWTTVGADWLSFVDASTMTFWQPVAVHVAEGPAERAGALWTRELTGLAFYGSCYDAQYMWEVDQEGGGEEPGGGSEADDVQLLFTEVDGMFAPRARAVEVASWAGAPWSYCVPFTDGVRNSAFEADIALPHFNSSVTRLDDGTYVAVWVEHDVSYDTLFANEVTGTIWARLIRCE